MSSPLGGKWQHSLGHPFRIIEQMIALRKFWGTSPLGREFLNRAVIYSPNIWSIKRWS